VNLLDWALHHRKTVFGVFAVAIVSTLALLPFVGRDFFPTVDAGQIPPCTSTHRRAHGLNPTEKDFTAVAQAVRELIPESERDGVTDVIGVPDGINLAVTTATSSAPPTARCSSR
jgi:multidrug efflux pump subunit AcrB